MIGDDGRIIRVRDAVARREARLMGRADIDRIDRFRAALTELGYDAVMVERILTARFGAAALALRDLQRQLETGRTAWDIVSELTATYRHSGPERAAERFGIPEDAAEE